MGKDTIILTLGAVTLGAFGGLALRFQRGRQRAERVWAASRYPKLQDMGTVERLVILPLIDWYSSRDDLASEAGVSYLIRADDTTILFDVGCNLKSEHPSPLLRNMERLGVKVADIDAVFISHAHLDHVGGLALQRQRRFDLSAQPIDLGGKPAFVPVPLANPSAKVQVVDQPAVIAPGVASLGTIPRQMFFLGWTPEQSLAVNVAGKGIVVIVGCGHPTLPRILERTEMLFNEPIYGVIGGLHYPVTGGRGKIPAQMLLGTGKWPWRPINRADVRADIAALERRQPNLVSLSAHDSCDWSLSAFQEAFAESYQKLWVGQEIIV